MSGSLDAVSTMVSNASLDMKTFAFKMVAQDTEVAIHDMTWIGIVSADSNACAVVRQEACTHLREAIFHPLRHLGQNTHDRRGSERDGK